MTWTSFRTASAIWLGTLLGIYAGGWLQAQPGPESSMGQFPLPRTIGMRREPLLSDPAPRTVLVRLEHENSWDAHGIQFFALVLPQGRATISVDADVPFSRLLHELTRAKRVLVTFQPEATLSR